MISDNKIAFVLLPGFSPDNYTVTHLQNKLLSLGYYAIAVPFWGDTTVGRLSDLTIQQCKEGVASVISSLSDRYDFIVGIGISLGGALLIEHAKTHSDLNHIVSIGTPFKLKNQQIISFLFFLFPLIHFLWKIGNFIGIKRMLPVDTSKMVFSYLEGDFLKDLKKVQTPILLLHCKDDMVTDFSVLPFFLDKIMSKEKKAIYFKNIGHTMGYDKNLDEEIVKSILSFFPKNNA